MKPALLDVSVLFALIYARHQRHDDAQAWFAERGFAGWATCAYTQMSVMRLLASSFAEDLNLSLPVAAAFVRQVCLHPGHRYWLQDVVPSGTEVFAWDQMSALNPGRNQFPDLYLLALAVRNNAVFVTLDRKIDPRGVKGADPGHIVIF